MNKHKVFGGACQVVGVAMIVNSLMCGPNAYVWGWYAVVIGVACGALIIAFGITWIREHQ